MTSAKELEQHVRRAYQQCSAYGDHGEVMVRYKRAVAGSERLSKLQFETQYIAPQSLVLNWSGGVNGALGSVGIRALAVDEEGAELLPNAGGPSMKFTSVQKAIAQATGSSWGVAARVPMLLLSALGHSARSLPFTPRVSAEGAILGESRTIICEGKNAMGGGSRIWFDCASFLILRVCESVVFGPTAMELATSPLTQHQKETLESSKMFSFWRDFNAAWAEEHGMQEVEIETRYWPTIMQ